MGGTVITTIVEEITGIMEVVIMENQEGETPRMERREGIIHLGGRINLHQQEEMALPYMKLNKVDSTGRTMVNSKQQDGTANLHPANGKE